VREPDFQSSSEIRRTRPQIDSEPNVTYKRQVKLNYSILALSALFLSSCGAPPPTPELPKHVAAPIERVLLDDSIDLGDIRQIFEALNQSDKLKGIAPWIQRSTDADLGRLGKLLNDHIFQTALDKKGLVALLSERVSSRSFSSAANHSSRLGADQRKNLTELALAAVRSPYWLELVERDIRFISPELDESLKAMHQDFQKAWSPESPACESPVIKTPSTLVDDLTRFLGDRSLRNQWVVFTDSLVDSWPIVGLLRALRKVDRKYAGKAFDGMGDGLGKMIRTPLDASKGPVPTQFDAFSNLILALNGPSDGLFTAIQKNLEKNPELVRMIGDPLQPNLPDALFGYAPFIPKIIFGLFIAQLDPKEALAITRKDWLAMASDPNSPEGRKVVSQVYLASVTATEFIRGAQKTEAAPNFLSFNLPIYLNSYVVAHWLAQALAQNRAALELVDEASFAAELWNLPVSVKPFELDFTQPDPTKETVFNPARIQELTAFGMGAFADRLSMNSPIGLGGFVYSVPALEGVPLKEALSTAWLAMDEVNGYSDGSGLVRAVVHGFIARDSTGKSFLDNLESANLLQTAHQQLASTSKETWKRVTSMLFKGLGTGSSVSEEPSALLSFYEEDPKAQAKFSRILSSVGALNALDARPETGLSALEAYQEIVQGVGPIEWKALSDGWGFIASSGLFATDLVDGKSAPRFPSAYSAVANGNSSGIFRLAANLEPNRYRALADFLDESMREKAGVKGSALHWDFLEEMVQKSPRGVETLVALFFDGAGSGIRDRFSAKERDWIVSFVHEGGFRDLWTVLEPFIAKGGGTGGWVSSMRSLLADGTLKSTFRMLSLIKNERMQAIGKLLQDLESSGELLAILDSLDFLVEKPGN
jgi:hypothetical protein